MQRALSYLFLLMLPLAMRGQELSDWKLHYWFDNTGKVQSAELGDGKFEIDVSNIPTGAHSLYLQVEDPKGVLSDAKSYLFYKMPTETFTRKLRYNIDFEQGMNELEFGQGNFILDVSAYPPGLHFLQFYVVEGENRCSEPKTIGFYRMPIASAQRLYYWFSGDEQATEVTDLSNGFVVDVTRLPDGFNTMYTQIVDKGYGDIVPYNFIKVAQTEGNGDLTVACIIDGKLVAVEKAPCQGGVVKLDMDVSNVEVGLHKAMFQVLTPGGAGSSLAETYFIRTLSEAEAGTMQCSYTIDGYKHFVHNGTVTNGIYHFDLPVAELEDGLHRIDYMLVAENGVNTNQSTAWFYKTPVGGNGITQYEYWLNEKTDEKQTMILEEYKDPFQLIKLLPLPSEPIRSSCFHFEVKDNKPMMYAKNDIHFRFHDRSGRWVDESRQFIDYSVKQEVDDVVELQTMQTFERPDSNEVKWFKFDAVYGDSISLKSSQATSMQVFDATGKVLYSVFGSNSIVYGGCHLFADGTYYVAIHDVTGSNEDVTINAERIDRFAIFDHTPKKMSGVGVTYFYFKGNGLDFVKSIELTNGDVVIHPDTIVAVSSDMLARFSTVQQLVAPEKFSLNLSFHIEEENCSKTIELKDAVTLEPANYGKVEISIETEPKVGDPFPIKVTMKNTGNVGSYGVPLNVAFDNDTKIDEFHFLNFDLTISEQLLESKEFFAYTDNLVGTGKEGFFMPLQIPYLGPYEEKTLVFGLKTQIPHARLNFYAWSGKPWYAPYKIPNASYSRSSDGLSRASSGSSFEDECSDSNIPRPDDVDPNNPYDPSLMYEPADLVDNLMDSPINPGRVLKPWLGVGEAIGGIIQAGTRARDDATIRACGLDPNDPDNDQYRWQYKQTARSPQEIWNDANPFRQPAQKRNMPSSNASSYRTGVDDYASRNCPPPPPHPTNVWIPGDPNEIIGYKATSGSRYMVDSVQTIYYDIEFENDPEIANASAHIIVVENLLDTKLFDVTSFTPKDITISGKKVELDGNPSFVKTIDMRPEINAIAELRGEFNSVSGLAKYTLTSLDPMTMEPTFDIMQGILPINYDGTLGIGNITYSIDLLKKFPDGTHIPNQASITFDYNEPILTPVWTNIVDAVSPDSRVTDVIQKNDTITSIHFEGSDARSGVWKYELYAQYGEGSSWLKVAECGADSSYIDFRFYEGTDYGFCVLATDSAGNVEQKELIREMAFSKILLGDVNSDGVVDAADVVLTTGKYLGQDVYINMLAADVNDDGIIDAQDVVGIQQLFLQTDPQRIIRKTKKQRKRLW